MGVSLPTMRYLRSLGDPRVHPNGFIQLDLNRSDRLHVWHPGLPYRQRTYHTVHDHVFGFVSTCFSGRLVNVVYDVAPDPAGTHVLWQAECTDGEESVLRPATGEPVRLRHIYAQVVQPGETYHLPAFKFHESLFGEPSLTIIRKDSDTAHEGNPHSPLIAVPAGVEPDNDFRRDAVDVDVLWGLIEEAYPS